MLVLVAHFVRLTTKVHTRDPQGDAGQTTAEYALVVVGAAMIAVLVVAWATGGGGGGKVGQLLDRVFDVVTQQVG